MSAKCASSLCSPRHLSIHVTFLLPPEIKLLRLRCVGAGASAQLPRHCPLAAAHAQLRRAPRLPGSGGARPELLVVAGNGGAPALATAERPRHRGVAQESQHCVLARRLQPPLRGKDQESAAGLPEQRARSTSGVRL